MRKALGLSFAALLVVTIGMTVFVNRSASQDDYAERIASLETRVAVLETAVTGKSDTSAESDAQPVTSVTGTGDQLTGPYALDPGRYRVSFTCHETAGVAILTAEDGATILQDSKDGKVGEQILPVSKHHDGLYLEVNCDADWEFTISPV